VENAGTEFEGNRAPDISESQALDGVNGWLKILFWWTIISPVLRSVSLFQSWSDYSFYISYGFGNAVYFDIFGTAVWVLVSFYSAYLIYTRRSLAKEFLFFGLILRIVIDQIYILWTNHTVKGLVADQILTPDESKTFLLSNRETLFVLVTLLWISYLLSSKRVRATLLLPISDNTDDA